MTATAQGQALRCDYAGCSQPGTVEIDAWAYCQDHAGRQHRDAAPARPRRVVVEPFKPHPAGAS